MEVKKPPKMFWWKKPNLSFLHACNLLASSSQPHRKGSFIIIFVCCSTELKENWKYGLYCSFYLKQWHIQDLSIHCLVIPTGHLPFYLATFGFLMDHVFPVLMSTFNNLNRKCLWKYWKEKCKVKATIILSFFINLKKLQTFINWNNFGSCDHYNTGQKKNGQ